MVAKFTKKTTDEGRLSRSGHGKKSNTQGNLNGLGLALARGIGVCAWDYPIGH